MTSIINTFEKRSAIVRNNIIDFIRDRELSWCRNTSPEFCYMSKEDLRETISSKIPKYMRKEIIRYPKEEKCDKIFAAQWIDTDNICFGTKDNQLLLWRYSTGDITKIPFPEESDVKVSSGDPEIPRNTSETIRGLLTTTGIHDIDINPSGTHLVSGGKNDHDMALFELPYMKPSAILRGHHDCVFSSKFISDKVLLSGGRDGALMLWDLSSIESITDDEDSVKIIEPIKCVMNSPFRMRSIQHAKYSNRAYVLCGDCSLIVLDCHTMFQTQKTLFPEELDLVCLAVSEENGVVSVGCQSGTQLLDMRTGNKFAEICDVGLPYGVRSLVFNRDVLTMGGGDGTVDFYDVRMLSRKLPHPLICSKGSIRKTEYYPEDISHCDIPQAIYTLAYDPDYSSKLFVGGGPLVCGLSGSYASIWA